MLDDIEYLAFLFNRGYIKDEQAREMWIPSVRGAIINGFEALEKARKDPANSYPECQKILKKTPAQKH
jgi:3-deoxy-D-arabino-heptulosonate 7-phosphate (DAHP) synthase class II